MYANYSRSDLKILCENKKTIGWEPTWSKNKFMETLGSEIDDFLELGMPKSSLLSSLKPAPNK